jgi:hypothetical protein
MGTPHEGSDLAPLALIFERILSYWLTNFNKKLLQVLVPSSDVLCRITNSFTQILDQNQIRVVCFYEELSCPGLSKQVSDDGLPFRDDS